MKEAKNIYKKCGGKLVVEYFGYYGTVYPIKRDGTQGKSRIRRVLYEESGNGDAIIYCSECGHQINGKDFEEMRGRS